MTLRQQHLLRRIDQAGSEAWWEVFHLSSQLSGAVVSCERRSTLYLRKAKASATCALLPDKSAGVLCDGLRRRVGLVETLVELPLALLADLVDVVWNGARALISVGQAVAERARERGLRL